MEHSELPLGFGMALAQNPSAMQHFAALSEGQKAEILQRVRGVSSKSEMQLLVSGLSPSETSGAAF